MSYGLVFDVDGVIADTEPIVAQATIEMFRELYGVEFKPEDFEPFIGTGAVRYVEGPAENAGISIDTKQAVAKRTENFVRILESGVSIVFPGVHELIEAGAASPDWKLAIATSGPSGKSRATLKAANVPLDVFTAFITGDMVTHKKPHPEIYETAAAVLGIPPAHCVVVEDAVNGIEAAKAAGMNCIAVTNSFSAEALAHADLVVGSLTKVNLDTLGSMVGTGAQK